MLFSRLSHWRKKSGKDKLDWSVFFLMLTHRVNLNAITLTTHTTYYMTLFLHDPYLNRLTELKVLSS